VGSIEDMPQVPKGMWPENMRKPFVFKITGPNGGGPKKILTIIILEKKETIILPFTHFGISIYIYLGYVATNK
jgi:hypothetical protein